MRFKQTDAGRSLSSNPHEDSDCTVRALATVANLQYDEAHAIMRRTGRKFLGLASMFEGLDTARNDGRLEFEQLKLSLVERIVNAAPGFTMVDGGGAFLQKRMTEPSLAQFVKTHKRGRYIVRVMTRGSKRIGHVFAIVDGVVHDNERPHGRRYVKAAWKIEVKA